MNITEYNRLRARFSWFVALFALIYAGILLYYADVSVRPGLDKDRYAFMESLVEHGSFNVEQSHYQSVDRIRFNGHYYSGKPPVLNFVGAGVYWCVYHGLHWSFLRNEEQVVRVMIAVFVSLPLACLLFVFWRVVSRRDENVSRTLNHASERRRLWLGVAATLMLAFASLLPPYGEIFTNHVLAALLLFASFAMSLGGTSKRPFAAGALVGFLAALSATIDLLPGTMFLIGLAVAAGWLRRQGRWVFGLLAGAAGPLVLHLVLNRITMGTWLTSYFVKDAFNYPGSMWLTPSQDDDNFPSYWSALYHYTIGHRSTILLLPLLVYGAVHAVRVGVNEGESSGPRVSALAAVFTLVATVVLVPAFSMGLAGATYGNRHLLPVIPLLYAYLPLEVLRAKAVRSRVAFGVVTVWSTVIGLIGTMLPWTPYVMSTYAPLDVIAAQLAKNKHAKPVGWIIDHTGYNPAAGYQALGLALWQAGDPKVALAAQLTAVKIQPNRGGALYAAGFLAREVGDSTTSLEMFSRVLAQEPKNGRALANLGLTQLELGRDHDAFVSFQKALAMNSNNEDALTGMTSYYMKGGDVRQARVYAERLLLLRPASPVAQAALHSDVTKP